MLIKTLVIILIIAGCGRGGISCPQKPQPAVDSGKQDSSRGCELKR